LRGVYRVSTPRGFARVEEVRYDKREKRRWAGAKVLIRIP
jgi:hypothetical protein